MAARRRRTFVPDEEEGERFEEVPEPAPKAKESPKVESAPTGVGGSYTTDKDGNRTLVDSTEG